jgi:hypothetical protein
MRCLSCHYDLKNLTEHRCPECGRAFRPNDPATFLPPGTPPRLSGMRLVQAALCSQIALSLIFVGALLRPGVYYTVVWEAVAAAFACTLLIFSPALLRMRHRP